MSSIGEPTTIFTASYAVEIYNSYPNEQKLLVGIGDGEAGRSSVGLFDLVEKKLLSTYPTIYWSPNADWAKEENAILYTVGRSGMKSNGPLWRIDMGMRSVNQPFPDLLTSGIFAKDPLTGDIWAETTESSIKALPTSAGKRVAPLTLDGLATLPSDDYIRHMAWSFDGQWLALYSHQGIFYLIDRQNQNSCRFDMKAMMALQMESDYYIHNILWSPTKHQLILVAFSGVEDERPISHSFPLLLDVEKKRVDLIDFQLAGWQHLIDRSWSPDGTYITFRTATYDNKDTLHLYDPSIHQVMTSRELKDTPLSFTSMAWVSNDQLVNTCTLSVEEQIFGLCSMQVTLR